MTTFCFLGENCSVFDRHSKTPGISLRNPLCEGCRNRARRELNLLRYDYVDLSQLIAKSDRLSEAKISRPKPESSPTIDLAVFTLRSEIAESVDAAALALRHHLGSPEFCLQMREGYALSDAIHYLDPRVDDLALLPASAQVWVGEEYAWLSGAELLVRFGALHRRSRRVCGVDPATIAVPGVCPFCAVPSLRRYDDDPERYWCAACHMNLGREQYYAAQRMQFAPVTPAAEAR